MKSEPSIGSTGLWASVAGNAVGRPTVNAEDGSAVSAEVRATVKVEAWATVEVQAGATINAEGHSGVKAGDHPAVTAEDRATVKAGNCSAVNAEDRATAIAKECANVNAEAWVTAKAEDGATVIAEDRATVSAKDPGSLSANDRKEPAYVNAGVWVTAKSEDHASASADDRSAVSAEARATPNAKESAYVNPEAWVTAKVEGRAAVCAEDRATVSAEACSSDSAEARAIAHVKESTYGSAEAWVTAKVDNRTTVSAEDRVTVSAEDPESLGADGRSAANAEDTAATNGMERATVNAGAWVTAKPEHRATASTDDRSAVRAEARASPNAKESAYVNPDAWVTAKVEGRAAVGAEDRATVSAEAYSSDSAEARATANAKESAYGSAEAWVTAEVEDRATVSAEDRVTVSAEARSAVNVEDRATGNAEESTYGNAEAPGTFFGDNRAAVSAEARSHAHATSHLARSRTLFRGLDDTRNERRRNARTLARMDPEQRPLEIAFRNGRELARLARLPGLPGLPNTHPYKRKQGIFDKAPAPTRGETELLARSDLARMNHQEMLREVVKLNRAKRIAVRVAHRRARQVALDLKKVNMELGAAKGGQGTTRTLGGPTPAEPIAEGLRAGGQDANALAKVEIGRINRAKRAVAFGIKRRRKTVLALERTKLRASKLILEKNEAHEARARPSCRKAEGIRSTREHGHARNLSDRCHSQEMKEASWGDGGVCVEIRVDEGRGRRITADEASTTRERTLRNGRGNVDGMEAREEELGTGEVNGKKTAAVDGTGAGESPAVEARHKELREKAIVEAAGGFPVIDAMHEELRAKAIVEASKRFARDAVEVERKAERARARHAEKARRRAEKQQKLERRASRDARRRKKLQDRESRAQLNGGSLRTPVERMGEPARLERDVVERRGGMLAQHDGQDDVHAAAATAATAGPLAGVGKRSTATRAAVDFGPESSVRIGLGEVGMSTQWTAPMFQALTRSQPEAASGDTRADNASRFAATISGGGRNRELGMGCGGGRGGIEPEEVETYHLIGRFRTFPNGQRDSQGPTPPRLGALPQFYSR